MRCTNASITCLPGVEDFSPSKENGTTATCARGSGDLWSLRRTTTRSTSLSDQEGSPFSKRQSMPAMRRDTAQESSVWTKSPTGPLDFELPAELEAREPPEARGLSRDQVRLMVSHLGDDSVEHHRFVDLPDVLHPGDLLVANDSATVPAALTVCRADGSMVALHVSTRLPGDMWVVEPRLIDATEGETFELPAGATVRLLVRYMDSRRLWIATFSCDVSALMARYGQPIAYPYVEKHWPIGMYQT